MSDRNCFEAIANHSLGLEFRVVVAPNGRIALHSGDQDHNRNTSFDRVLPITNDCVLNRIDKAYGCSRVETKSFLYDSCLQMSKIISTSR